MFICTSAALNESSKKKETVKKKDKVELFKHASDRRKKAKK